MICIKVIKKKEKSDHDLELKKTILGEGFCVGRDSGDPVSRQYTSKFDFGGGSTIKVIYDVGNDTYQNLENEFKVKMARE